MDRRSLIKQAGIGGVLAAGAASAVQAQGRTVRWRLASSFPKSLDILIGGTEAFAREVSDLSHGKFIISVHPADDLMPAFAVVDGVQSGAVECAHTAPYYFYGKDEAFALDCSIPFGLNSRQLSAWMFAGNGLKLMREFYANFNIVNFPMGNSGAQMGGWYRKEIRSLADIKGLKMRIGGFGGKILGRIGGLPLNIPAGEIYHALEKGTVDAAEWIGPYDDLKLGLHKVAAHYYYPGWWEGSTQFSLLVNQKAYEGLSAENKAIIRAAASEAHVTIQANYDYKNPGALKTLVTQGAKLHPFPNDIMLAAYQAAQQVFAELNASNAHWKKIFADFSAYRGDANLWFRFSEARFDSFMQSQRL